MFLQTIGQVCKMFPQPFWNAYIQGRKKGIERKKGRMGDKEELRIFLPVLKQICKYYNNYQTNHFHPLF
jgi:hypothetical protein